MIIFRPRHGIGLDIEYNEDIIHKMVFSDDEECFYGFNGVIIKLPLCQLYIGDMFEMEDE